MIKICIDIVMGKMIVFRDKRRILKQKVIIIVRMKKWMLIVVLVTEIIYKQMSSLKITVRMMIMILNLKVPKRDGILLRALQGS